MKNELFLWVYDIYSEEIITSEQNLLFNHNQIVRVLHMGYNSDKEKEFKQRLENAINKIENSN